MTPLSGRAFARLVDAGRGLLNAYLDASVMVSLFVNDGHTAAAEQWMAGLPAPASLSRWTAAEFSAAPAARIRSASTWRR